jgi:hypothetical protein
MTNDEILDTVDSAYDAAQTAVRSETQQLQAPSSTNEQACLLDMQNIYTALLKDNDNRNVPCFIFSLTDWQGAVYHAIMKVDENNQESVAKALRRLKAVEIKLMLPAQPSTHDGEENAGEL